MNDTFAGVRLTEADLNETYFAWSGPLTHEAGRNGSSCYLYPAPTAGHRFSPQGVGGHPTMHVHTIYRDPTNDYGVKLTGAK